ncbi:hypothetical protein GCM10011506_08310 [Marivirga lumbricoides]|uniref:Outer membrane protein beta-barrel domain-containing protein n=1 Tax=Marivirga lumbricoides TaxID=1046115 RepID=A0ABQ1LQ53_9BACT|nr:hypothetical protein GCM10011506_08310 [Marivirga lumbricoides]
MKKIAIILGVILVSLELNAQTGNYFDPEERPKFYLGIGTGMNSYTGLAGISANYIIDNKLFAQAGLGLSTWGFRSSIGLRYDQSYNNGLTFGINYIHSSGIPEIDLELEDNSGSTREVNMLFESVGAINLKTGYNWWIGKYTIFNMKVGYSIPFKSSPWVVNDGTNLSPISEEVLRILAPGGIIFELGFSFGL